MNGKRTKHKIELDEKRLQKSSDLIGSYQTKDIAGPDEFAIWHLEKILTEIVPYSHEWYMGRSKAVNHAINILKKRNKKLKAVADKNYDKENDVMYITFANTDNSYGDEGFINGLVIHRDINTEAVTGITIFDFSKKFKIQEEHNHEI